MKYQITGYFQKRIATWDQDKFSYVDKKDLKITTKDLEIEFLPQEKGSEIVKFHGTPVGFTSEFLPHLQMQKFKKGDIFELFPGVINRFAKCWVLGTDLKKVLIKAEKEK